MEMEIGKRSWDLWIEETISKMDSLSMFGALRPMRLPTLKHYGQEEEAAATATAAPKIPDEDEFEIFRGVQPWDRLCIQASIPETLFQRLLNGENGSKYERDEDYNGHGPNRRQYKKLTMFVGNDFLALGRHPAVAKFTMKATAEHGTGPRGVPLICGYTDYHMALETTLARIKQKEACLLCPTGFAANMAVLNSIGNIAQILSKGRKSEEKIAVFSDSLNHASIIDGILLAKQQGGVELFVYRHCDMSHLDALLTSCEFEKKVVITDGLFSMDGDFAPMVELVRLRKKHGFLFVVDDAHGSFVWGKNGGGVAEEFDCEEHVDICVGTLSKAASSLGGFVACSKLWKQLIQSRGRAFLFSTTTTVPLVAASYAAVLVGKKEPWRRLEVRRRIREFEALTGLPAQSQILCIIMKTREKAEAACRDLLISGYYVVAIGPPVVPPNTWRLRMTLTAAHTTEDIQNLVKIISRHIKFEEMDNYDPKLHAKAKL